MIYHQGASLSKHDLMFCHGTQTTDNSRICHCLLFDEHDKHNFVQPFLQSRKLLRLYTHALTKLHTEVMSWIWCLWVSLCMALTWSELNYCAWFVPSVSSLRLSVMVRSRIQYIHRRGVRWWEIHRVNFHERALVHVQIWNVRIRSFNLNLRYMATCKQMDRHTHASCNAWIYIITVCVQTPSLPYLSWLL